MKRGEDVRRSIVMLVALLVAFGAVGIGASPALADTSAQTGVSLEVTDPGTLDVHWSADPVVFLADGESPAPTATDDAIATGILTLIVHDTRSDATRLGYAIAISSPGLQIGDDGATLSASNLALLDVQGLPGGILPAQLVGSTLDQPVTILTVQAGDAAVNTTIAITIQLTVPSGSMPGSYSGDFNLDVLPVGSGV